MRVSFASAAGSPDKPNEDWVGATTNTAIVLDGITTTDGLPTGCEHGTIWFVHQLGAWLLGLASTEPGVSLRDHLAASIRNVADTHADTCDTTHIDTPGAAVAVLREHDDQLEWLVLADAFVVLDTAAGVQVQTDARIDMCAVEERAALLREQLGSFQHKEAKQILVTAQRRHRNTEGGYWVAAANPQAADHALTGTHPRLEVNRAAVLSDGAAALAQHVGVPWPEVLELLHELGPASLIERIRRAEAEDPDGRRWPRFKRSDDAAVAYGAF